MKGSILFNPDINIEVDVDPSAAEGERLVSAKNLVDGQEAGGGGGGNKYAPYDFVIWIHYDENSGGWINEAVKGTFAELKTALLSGALVVGLYAYTSVSGDWAETQVTDTLWVQYNPSRDAVEIRGVASTSSSTPSEIYLAWDSEGIFSDE